MNLEQVYKFYVAKVDMFSYSFKVSSMRGNFNAIIVFVSGATAARTPCLGLEKPVVLESCYKTEEKIVGDKASGFLEVLEDWIT